MTEIEASKEVVSAVTSVASAPAAAAKKLTDRQLDKVVKQIEFYFSDSNLPRDACVSIL